MKYIESKGNSKTLEHIQMENYEKAKRLEMLEMALEDVNKIIDNMQKSNYTEEQINEYNKQRWNIWNEMYKVKQS